MKNKNIKQIKVWDLPIRIFHWALLVLILAALLSGFFAPEWWLNYHIWIGYVIIGLVIFRLIWGFFGSSYSRFVSFIFSPKILLEHIKGINSNQPIYFLGHNPLGALMVFALLFVISAIIISGLINLGGIENQGPFAFLIDYATGFIAGKWHIFLAYLLIIMIFLHILGVIFESKISRISLVRAMINGKKPNLANLDNKIAIGLIKPQILPTISIMAIFAIIFIGGYFLLSRQAPSGFILMEVNEDFQSECADCHELYSPSLLPASSWEKMMNELDNHFGEDASLDIETTKNIAAYLRKYSAENWDSEASNNFMIVDNKAPYKISETPFWKERHKNIDENLFKTKPVKGKGNCSACHADAELGYFHDKNIKFRNKPVK